jgi:iron(III) transport system substrate-binding protein
VRYITAETTDSRLRWWRHATIPHGAVVRLLLLLLAPILLLGCGGGAQPASTAAPSSGTSRGSTPASGAAATVPETGSSSEWDQLVAAARQEGRLVIAAAPNPELRVTLPTRFKERFGVEVEYIASLSAQQATKLTSERAAGLYTLDVILGGPDTLITVMLPEQMLDPIQPLLILPDIADPSKWVRGKPWYLDPEERYLIRLINQHTYTFSAHADFVNPDEIRTPEDLLQPRWKGRIAAGSYTAGSGNVVAGRMLKFLGEDFLRNLYHGQEVVVASDDRQLADWIARGSHQLAIALNATQRDNLRDLGVNVKPVKMNDHPVAGEISSGQFNLGLMNRAPHPHAARLFVNWILTQEAMQLIADAEAKPVTRTDVDYSRLDPDVIPRPGTQAVDGSAWDYVVNERRPLGDRARAILQR